MTNIDDITDVKQIHFHQVEDWYIDRELAEEWLEKHGLGDMMIS